MITLSGFRTLDQIRKAGFEGFHVAGDLLAFRGIIPDRAGVYLVVRDDATPPSFRDSSVAGWFKDKDPTVPVDTLASKWVADTVVIYIGKAGGGSSAATLRDRLKAYVRFGSGKPVGHWGGRYIWQLHDSAALQFCWRVTGDLDAHEVERVLIDEFLSEYGQLPFANLRGGR